MKEKWAIVSETKWIVINGVGADEIREMFAPYTAWLQEVALTGGTEGRVFAFVED